MLRAIVAGLLVVTLTSCNTWTPVPMSPTNYIRSHDPSTVWLQLEDSSTMIMGRPRVLADSLRGIVAGVYRTVPLSRVKHFKAQEISKSKTALLVTAGVVFTVGLVYLAATSDHVTE
jgi:hypothetical protein